MSESLEIFIRQSEEGIFDDHQQIILPPTTTQEEIFQQIGLPLINNAIKGQTGYIFMYGYQGSGKTYTLIGNSDGLLPRTLSFFGNNNSNGNIRLYEIQNEGTHEMTNFEDILINQGNQSHKVFILDYQSSTQESNTHSKIYFIELSSPQGQNYEALLKSLVDKSIPQELQNLISQFEEQTSKIVLLATINPNQAEETQEVLLLLQKIKAYQRVIQDTRLQSFQEQFDKITALFQQIQENAIELQSQQKDLFSQKFSEKKIFITEIMRTIDLQLNPQQESNPQQQLSMPQIQFQNPNHQHMLELQEQRHQNELLRIKMKYNDQISQLQLQNRKLEEQIFKLQNQIIQEKQLRRLRRNKVSLQQRCNRLQALLVEKPPKNTYQNLIDEITIAQLQQLEDIFFHKKDCRQVEFTTNIFRDILTKINNLNSHDQIQQKRINEMKGQLALQENQIAQKVNQIENLSARHETKMQELSETQNLIQQIEGKLFDYFVLAFNNTNRCMTIEQQKYYIQATQRDQQKFMRVQSLLDLVIVTYLFIFKLDTIVYHQNKNQTQ